MKNGANSHYNRLKRGEIITPGGKCSHFTTNSRLGVEMRANLKEIVYCPVSGNQPLRCTMESFTKGCSKQISLFDHGGPGFNGYCGICRGKKIPKNVEFIELEQLKGGEMLEKSPEKPEKTRENRQKTDNSGKNAKLPKTPITKVSDLKACECCGRSAAKLRPASGIRACPTCQVIVNAVKNRPEVVLAQLERLGKIDRKTSEQSSGDQIIKLQYALGVAEEELADAEREMIAWKYTLDKRLKEQEESQAEISKLKAAIGGWEQYYQTSQEAAQQTIADAERSLDDALKQLAHEREISAQLASKVDSMIDAELYDSLPAAIENTAPMVPVALFDLALDALGGKITGLDADRLRALRGVM